MNPTQLSANSETVMQRASLLVILDAAIETKSYRFARQTALSWLAVFPGDLGVSLLLGKALQGEGKITQAAGIFEKLVRQDPEFFEAYRALEDASTSSELKEEAHACAAVLDPAGSPGTELPNWAFLLRRARAALQAGRISQAEEMVHQAIGINPNLALGAVTHLAVTTKKDDRKTVGQLAGLYHSRWTDCLQFTLALADARLEFGEEAEGVELLHECVAGDAAGQVGKRLWGESNRYQQMWPGRLEIELELLIPAEVASRLGRNRIGAGSVAVQQAEVPEEISGVTEETAERVASESEEKLVNSVYKPVEEKLARMAKKMKNSTIAQTDGRFPVYVIFSSKTNLVRKYGQHSSDVIDAALNDLSKAVGKREGWNSVVYYPDDANTAAKFGVKVIATVDPWKMKLALTDFDAALGKKGQRIGAVIIVGGPDVVPFHMLPNPTDDSDAQVPSDNPYATTDSNYFVPEWPVGRLPGEAGEDAGLLLDQIRRAVEFHSKQTTVEENWLARIMRIITLFFNKKRAAKNGSFGMTASVWKQSSKAVFGTIAGAKSILLSPPIGSSALSQKQLNNSTLEYFNLHGLADTPEWYGQRDPRETSSGPDYPVAITANNLQHNGKAPKYVFSEACFGGWIEQKTVDQSIALKFLSIGTTGVIASSCIAYGSIQEPLIGADYLGWAFWRHLQSGLTAGEALMQAKADLVQEMNKRQGFLDGGDQKTLISFVLYGDPLSKVEIDAKAARAILRLRSHPAIKTISDERNEIMEAKNVDNLIREAKQAVEGYLPGLTEVDWKVNHQVEALVGTEMVAKNAGKKKQQAKTTQRTVVTGCKSVQMSRKNAFQFVRVTLDAHGKVVKMAISR